MNNASSADFTVVKSECSEENWFNQRLCDKSELAKVYLYFNLYYS